MTAANRMKEKNWALADYDDLLAGMRDPGVLRQVDRRGMTPTVAAALDSGSLVHRLMSLLDAPGMVSGETALDRIEELLTESVAQQRVTNEKLDAIIRILLGTAGDVKPPVKARRTRQGMPSEANA